MIIIYIKYAGCMKLLLIVLSHSYWTVCSIMPRLKPESFIIFCIENWINFDFVVRTPTLFIWSKLSWLIVTKIKYVLKKEQNSVGWLVYCCSFTFKYLITFNNVLFNWIIQYVIFEVWFIYFSENIDMFRGNTGTSRNCSETTHILYMILWTEIGLF